LHINILSHQHFYIDRSAFIKNKNAVIISVESTFLIQILDNFYSHLLQQSMLFVNGAVMWYSWWRIWFYADFDFYSRKCCCKRL